MIFFFSDGKKNLGYTCKNPLNKIKITLVPPLVTLVRVVSNMNRYLQPSEMTYSSLFMKSCYILVKVGPPND